MSNENLRSIQEVKEDIDNAGSPKLWFAVGAILNVGLIASLILVQAIRKRRASIKIQSVIDNFNMTEDGHKLEGGQLTHKFHSN